VILNGNRKLGSHSGARPHTRPRTIADAHGAQTAVLGVKLDPQDQPGRLVETYGLEVSASASGISLSSGRILGDSECVS
jgi:hypothetical protein